MLSTKVIAIRGNHFLPFIREGMDLILVELNWFGCEEVPNFFKTLHQQRYHNT